VALLAVVAVTVAFSVVASTRSWRRMRRGTRQFPNLDIINRGIVYLYTAIKEEVSTELLPFANNMFRVKDEIGRVGMDIDG
jgi:hypothetical protein